MVPTKEEVKEQVMAEAEGVITEMLEEAERKEQITLSDIEQLVRVAGQRMMEKVTAKLVEASVEGEGTFVCSECGQKMRYKGRKTRQVVTETGEVELNREYYYCQTCRTGIFPPG